LFGQHPFIGKAPFLRPFLNSHKKYYTTGVFGLFGLFGLFLLFGFIIRQDLQDYRDSFAVLSASGLQPRWAYAPA